MTWVFHVTASGDPDPAKPEYNWNHMADYYPDGTQEDAGDVVDWLGVSIYGVDNLDTGDCTPFYDQLKEALGTPEGKGEEEKLLALSRRNGKKKPIFILELGTALNYEVDAPKAQCRPEIWIKAAFEEIFNRGDKGEIAGFSWWNERFEGDGPSRKIIEMRFDHLQSGTGGETKAKEILEVYRSSLNNPRVAHADAEGDCQPLTCCVSR